MTQISAGTEKRGGKAVLHFQQSPTAPARSRRLEAASKVGRRDAVRVLFEVRASVQRLPHPLELDFGNLGALLHGKTRLFQRKLAHHHVIHTGQRQDGRPVRQNLHLARHPAAVEMGPPVALLELVRRASIGVGGTGEGDPEIALFLGSFGRAAARVRKQSGV